MLNNFIYAQSKAMFEERLAEVPNDAIVFIEDTKEIWTHGTYFDCSTLDPNVIPNIQTEINELRMSFDNKADIDGTYPNMTVGFAEDLGGAEFTQESEFSIRSTANNESIKDGAARIEAIKGNSVVWNQICRPFSDNAVKKPSAAIVNKDGVTIEAWSAYNPFVFPSNLLSRKGHKCILAFSYSNTTPTPSLNIEMAGTTRYSFTKDKENIALFLEIAQNSSKDDIEVFSIASQTGVVTLSNLHIYDLTQMFGAGNEPTTIDEFYKRKPMVADESAYNEGEVIHMDAQSIESVGFNQWDEEWELGTIKTADGDDYESTSTIRSKGYIDVLPNTAYVYSFGGLLVVDKIRYVYYYDKQKRFIGYRYGNASVRLMPFTTPSNCAYVRFVEQAVATYNHDICINLSNSQKNGTYEPYKRNEQSLDIIRKYFPNGMRSAGTAHDEIRYNKASGKWEAVQRIAEVDMGTLGWYISSNRCTISLSGSRSYTNAEIANIICSKYTANTFYSLTQNIKGIGMLNTALAVYDPAYTDAAAFKTAMSGVILYYELAEPVVTEITEDPTLAYEAWSGGTEKVIATDSTPLIVNTIYNFSANEWIKQNRFDVEELRETINNSNQSTAYAKINHGTSDTNFTLTPNSLHKWDSVDNLTLTLPADPDGIAYEYKIVFTAGENFSLTLPDNIRWENDEIPTFDANNQYEISIMDCRALISMFNVNYE